MNSTKLYNSSLFRPVPSDVLRECGHRDVTTDSLLLGDGLELPDHLALRQPPLQVVTDRLLGDLRGGVEGIRQALGQDVRPRASQTCR